MVLVDPIKKRLQFFRPFCISCSSVQSYTISICVHRNPMCTEALDLSKPGQTIHRDLPLQFPPPAIRRTLNLPNLSKDCLRVYVLDGISDFATATQTCKHMGMSIIRHMSRFENQEIASELNQMQLDVGYSVTRYWIGASKVSGSPGSLVWDYDGSEVSSHFYPAGVNSKVAARKSAMSTEMFRTVSVYT